MLVQLDEELKTLVEIIDLDKYSGRYDTIFHGIQVEMSLTHGLAEEERFLLKDREGLANQMVAAISRIPSEHKFLISQLLGVTAGWIEGYIEAIVSNMKHLTGPGYTNETIELDLDKNSISYVLEREVWACHPTVLGSKSFIGKVTLTPTGTN